MGGGGGGVGAGDSNQAHRRRRRRRRRRRGRRREEAVVVGCGGRDASSSPPPGGSATPSHPPPPDGGRRSRRSRARRSLGAGATARRRRPGRPSGWTEARTSRPSRLLLRPGAAAIAWRRLARLGSSRRCTSSPGTCSRRARASERVPVQLGVHVGALVLHALRVRADARAAGFEGPRGDGADADVPLEAHERRVPDVRVGDAARRRRQGTDRSGKFPRAVEARAPVRHGARVDPAGHGEDHPDALVVLIRARGVLAALRADVRSDSPPLRLGRVGDAGGDVRDSVGGDADSHGAPAPPRVRAHGVERGPHRGHAQVPPRVLPPRLRRRHGARAPAPAPPRKPRRARRRLVIFVGAESGRHAAGYLGLAAVFLVPALRPGAAKLTARLSVLMPLQAALLFGLSFAQDPISRVLALAPRRRAPRLRRAVHRAVRRHERADVE